MAQVQQDPGFRLAGRLLGVFACLGTSRAAAALPPEFPAAPAWTGRAVIATPTGTWQRFEVARAGTANRLGLRESSDHGLTWSEPRPCVDLPAGVWSGGAALWDRRGEIQLFFIRPRDGGGRDPAVDRFLDLWHLRSANGRRDWSEPRRIHAGYIGAISNAIIAQGAGPDDPSTIVHASVGVFVAVAATALLTLLAASFMPRDSAESYSG